LFHIEKTFLAGARRSWFGSFGSGPLGSARVGLFRFDLIWFGLVWFGLAPQVVDSDVLIDGCLFDDCYASKKGGGFHQEDGRASIVNSLFCNNTAGSINLEKGETGDRLSPTMPFEIDMGV